MERLRLEPDFYCVEGVFEDFAEGAGDLEILRQLLELGLYVIQHDVWQREAYGAICHVLERLRPLSLHDCGWLDR